MSVESTRYTLRKQIDHDFVDKNVIGNNDDKWEYIGWFLNFAEKRPDMPNDELKYFIPEWLVACEPCDDRERP